MAKQESREACGGPEASVNPVDGRFYQAAAPGSLGERVLVAARDRIYRDFLRFGRPVAGERILDIGVSDVVTEGANLIERLYPHPEDLTAAGLGEGSAFRAAYPKVRYDQVRPGEPLPYADRAFPLAVSNAVLEHVGSEAAQSAFLHEALRVADRVFLTVPNRYFPIEHHTAIPLAHWTDATFRLACRALGRTEWLAAENLILMTRARLAALVPRDLDLAEVEIGTTGFGLGPMSSNLYMFLRRR